MSVQDVQKLLTALTTETLPKPDIDDTVKLSASLVEKIRKDKLKETAKTKIDEITAKVLSTIGTKILKLLGISVADGVAEVVPTGITQIVGIVVEIWAVLTFVRDVAQLSVSTPRLRIIGGTIVFLTSFIMWSIVLFLPWLLVTIILGAIRPRGLEFLWGPRVYEDEIGFADIGGTYTWIADAPKNEGGSRKYKYKPNWAAIFAFTYFIFVIPITLIIAIVNTIIYVVFVLNYVNEQKKAGNKLII